MLKLHICDNMAVRILVEGNGGYNENLSGEKEQMEKQLSNETMEKEDINVISDNRNDVDSNEDNSSKSLDDIAMEALEEIKEETNKEEDKKEVEESESFPRIEDKNEVNEVSEKDEEFGDIDFDEDNFEVNFDFKPKEEQIDVKIPNSLKESKLEFILRYLFYFYFLILAYIYKIDEKTEFVDKFIERSKKTVDDLILRIERMFAKISPKLYNRIVRDSEILGTLIILVVLHYNFHIEATRIREINKIGKIDKFPVEFPKKEVEKEKIEDKEPQITEPTKPDKLVRVRLSAF